MPAMVRDPQNKATKVAYDLLGKPQNMQNNRKDKKRAYIQKRLAYEDTRLVR